MALEKKLTSGRYFQIPKTLPYTEVKNENPKFDQNFYCQTSSVLSIRESTGFFTKESVIELKERSERNKVHRNFHWLYYIGGKITYLHRTVDVLSGNFSGCWMIAFRYASKEYVAHIGTTEDKEVSKSIKEEWNTFVNSDKFTNNGGCILCGFKPFKSEYIKVFSHKCWGLITRDNRCFTVVLDDKKDGRYKILAVEPIQQDSDDKLKHLP